MTTFKAFRRFNSIDPRTVAIAGTKGRIDPRFLEWVEADTLYGKIVKALTERRALPIKEVTESFEFFENTRKFLRHQKMADLCCGHGLIGLLYAAAEKCVEEIVLLDRAVHPNQEVVLEAVGEAAPWVFDKVRRVQSLLDYAHLEIQPETSILAVHACGGRTDKCIEIAVAAGGAIAAMPCCYAKSAVQAPRAIATDLGPELASDIHRTYTLESAGYQVRWRYLPEQITPMNRILIATPDSSIGHPRPG